MSYEETEFDRRLANIIRLGVVAAIDLTSVPPTVKVDIGTDTEPHWTDWLPYMARRAGQTKNWSPPDLNEQVVILSPGGELSQGLVLQGGIFQDAFLANGGSQALDRTTYPDGSVVEYDSAAHKLTVSVGTGQVVVNCSQATVNADADVKLNCATATVTASAGIVLDTPSTVCKGALVVQGPLTYTAGMSGSSAPGQPGAAVQGNITLTGGDISADGIGLKSHHHMEQGDGAPTSAALA